MALCVTKHRERFQSWHFDRPNDMPSGFNVYIRFEGGFRALQDGSVVIIQHGLVVEVIDKDSYAKTYEEVEN